jgi:hypothetical protein
MANSTIQRYAVIKSHNEENSLIYLRTDGTTTEPFDPYDLIRELLLTESAERFTTSCSGHDAARPSLPFF